MKMNNEILPSSFTRELDCKMTVTTEKSAYFNLQQAGHKIELEFDIDGKYRFYQTTLLDLIKILEKADKKHSQSRASAPLEL